MTDNDKQEGFWDDPRRRAAVVYERPGSTKLIPAILRVPLPSKHKRADSDPEYLSRGGRGSKRVRQLAAVVRYYRECLAAEMEGLNRHE